MTVTVSDDLVVSGAVSAANFQFGSITITPDVGVPTAMEVKGLNVRGTGTPTLLLGAHSAYPWTRVQGVGHRFASSTGFTAYIYRTDGSDTNVHWFMIQAADL